MYNPFGGNKFPYTNFHELNLDWIIEIAKNFLDQYTNIQETIETGLEDLEAKKTELEGLLQAWYDEHSQDIADQLADALQDLNAWYTEHANYLDNTLLENEAAFDTHAEQKGAAVIASIPDDYTALSNQVDDLEDLSNLFSNKAVILDAYINYADKTIIRNDLLSKTICIPCLPNTKYIIEKDAGTRFVVACAKDEPAWNGTNYGTILTYISDDTVNKIEFTTAPNAKYLLAWVYHSTDDGTAIDMLKSTGIYIRETTNNLWYDQSRAALFIDINTKTLTSNSNAVSVFIPCEPNTTYRVKKTAGTRFTVASSVVEPANSVKVLTYNYSPTSSYIEYTTPPNAKYLIAWVYLSSSDTGVSAEDMLSSVDIEKISQVSNLWNGSNVLDVFINVVEKRLIRHDLLAKTIVIPCKQNTIYTVRKTAGVRFAIGTSIAYPTWNGTDYGNLVDVVSDAEANNLSIMTTPSANYLCIWVWLSTDSISADDMLSSVYVYENNLDLIFWGDSITAGYGGGGTTYPKICADILNKTHLNCGVGGETSNTIAARQGGNNLIIPAGDINGSYSDGQLMDSFNHGISPVRQGTGSNSGQTLIINGQICGLSITQTSATSGDAVYTISGYAGGASVFPLEAAFIGSEMTAEVTVIFVGQNGSWVGSDNNLENRIAIIDSMIKHIENNKYVIIGLASGTSAREPEELQLTKKYGSKYLPARAELVNYGLAIAGLSPTTQDTTDISNGTVPTSLRTDEFHLNSYGYTALGALLANKISALRYFE